MRIDGRSEPNPWVQPRNKENEISINREAQQQDRQLAFFAAEQRDADLDFAGEMQHSYAYTHATRTAATVAEILEETPDL